MHVYALEFAIKSTFYASPLHPMSAQILSFAGILKLVCLAGPQYLYLIKCFSL